jgi:hypothetical protein
VRPAKAHRRAAAARSEEQTSAWREEFRRQVAELRLLAAHGVAVDYAMEIASSQEEFDLLVAQMEASLLAEE